MLNVLNDRRLVIAHNPRSSRAHEARTQVFERLDKAGIAYETIEIQQSFLEGNIDWIRPQLRASDIVLCAAGDGSAHAVTHAVIAAALPGVQIGFLAFGNFNDLPHALNTKASLQDPIEFLCNAQVETFYPLEVTVNGSYFRNALLYATIGWTAQAASRFDQPQIRHRLQTGGAGILRSLWNIGWYYLKSRRSSYLPPFALDRRPHSRVTDVLCANGPTVARLFRTGKQYYQLPIFLCKKLNVASIFINVPFLLCSLLYKMPGNEKTQTTLDFAQLSTVPIQCDGEVIELRDVKQIRVQKSSVAMSVLATKH